MDFLLKNLKRLILALFIIFILLLDYAALDDITTGNEINVYLEYTILIASFAIFAIMIYKYIKNRG